MTNYLLSIRFAKAASVLLMSLATITQPSTAQQHRAPTSDSATIFPTGSDAVYTKVDTPVSYPGGKKAWQTFLVKNLRYPVEAMDNEIMGDTHVAFIVDVDGSISGIKAIDGDPILARESERVIALTGKWNPAVYQGQKIKPYHVEPIIYRLETNSSPKRRKNR